MPLSTSNVKTAFPNPVCIPVSIAVHLFQCCCQQVHSRITSQLSQSPELGDALRTQLMLQDNEGYGYVTREQLLVRIINMWLLQKMCADLCMERCPGLLMSIELGVDGMLFAFIHAAGSSKRSWLALDCS
jgi:hypothetical protein